MEKYLEIIKNSSLFTGSTEEEVKSMLGCLSAKKVEYKKGEFIFSAGDTIKNLYMVLAGRVHIIREDFWGNRSIITDVKAGEFFGETFACAHIIAIPVNAIAVQDCEILILDVNRVMTTCSSACVFHTRVVQNLIAILANKNLTLNGKIEHVSQRSTREKLLSYLSDQSQKSHSAEFDIPFNRQQLSDYLSIDRSAMSSTLGKLKDEGILDYNKNHFVLK